MLGVIIGGISVANIMIVDDSPVFRRNLRGILETMGHRIVKEVEDGREAIRAYNNNVDLVTMDIRLPGIDGIEAARQIRARNPAASIVMISSVELRSKVYEAIKLGVKHYIIKPYTSEKINEVVNAVLGIQRSGGENVRGDRYGDGHLGGHGDMPGPRSVGRGVQVASVQLITMREEEQLGRFPKKKEPLKLEAPYMPNVPFELVHKDGRSVLTIQRHIVDTNVRLFCSCLQGLLYYRKMKCIVELWEPVRHEEGQRLLFDFVAAVRQRNGTVAIVTADIAYFAQLKARLQNGVYRSYAEIEW